MANNIVNISDGSSFARADHIHNIAPGEVDISKITISPGEVLLVRLPRGTEMSEMRKFSTILSEKLNTTNIVVYAADKIDLLKVGLEEKMIEKLIDDEIQR